METAENLCHTCPWGSTGIHPECEACATKLEAIRAAAKLEGKRELLEEMKSDADAMYFQKAYGSPNSALSMHMAWRNALLKYAEPQPKEGE